MAKRPKPIICKFFQRLAREEVMSLHGRIDSSIVSLHAEAVFSNPHIVDNHQPKTKTLH